MTLQHDPEKKIVAKQDLLAQIQDRLDRLESRIHELKSHHQKLEAHRQSHLDLRERVISTYIRDTLHKENESREMKTLEINEAFIHGDVRNDARVVTERYKKSRTEYHRAFSTLYGPTPEEMNQLDQHKCHGSIQALDRVASILFEDARSSLPDRQTEKKRKELVAMLLEERYEEAEKMSSTILCADEPSMAEEQFD